MPPTVEKEIQVKIKALVEGLKTVKEFQATLSLIRQAGGKKFDLKPGDTGGFTKVLTVVRQLSPALDSAAIRAEDLAGALGKGSGLAGIAGPLGVIVALLAGAGVGLAAVLFRLASHAAEVGSRFHDMSIETGLSVETLSGIELQLKQSNATLEDFGKGVFDLQKNLAEAARSGKSFGLGIKDPEAALKDMDGTLRTVLRNLAAIPDEGTRNAEGARVMGRAYRQLRVFLADTNGDLDKTIEKARAAGLVMSKEAAQAADEFGDQLDQMRTVASRTAATLGVQLLPEFNRLFRLINAESKNTASVFGLAFDSIVGLIRQANRDLLVLLAGLKTMGQVGPSGFLDGTFQKNLAQLALEANTPLPNAGGPEGTGGLDKDGGESKLAKLLLDVAQKRRELARAVADAEVAAQASAADRALDLLKDGLRREGEQLDEQLERNLISLKRYYANRGRLQEQALTEEIARESGRLEESILKLGRDLARIGEDTKGKIAEVDADPKSKETDAEKQARKDAAALEGQRRLVEARAAAEKEQADIKARILKLERDLGDAQRKNGDDQAKALAELSAQMEETAAQLLDTQGPLGDLQKLILADSEKIKESFRQRLEAARANYGAESEAVKNLIALQDTLIAKAAAARRLARLDELDRRRQLDVETAQAGVRENVVAEEQARQRVLAVNREYLYVLLDELSALEARARKEGADAETRQAIQDRRNRINDLRRDIEGGGLDRILSDTAINSAASGAEEFADSLLKSVRSLKDLKTAGLEFAQSFLSALTQVIIKMLVLRAMSAIFGGGGGGGGGIGAAAGLSISGARAEGGLVSSRGFYDMAERGPEFVIKNSALRNIGVGALDFMNRTGRLPVLSAGASPEGFAPGAGGGLAPNVTLRNVNLFDLEDLVGAMATAPGERLLINFISRNPRKIRQLLGL